jgi:hypothetical protein
MSQSIERKEKKRRISYIVHIREAMAFMLERNLYSIPLA